MSKKTANFRSKASNASYRRDRRKSLMVSTQPRPSTDPRQVLPVKRRSKGICCFLSNARTLEKKTAPVADTVGAGDTFNAGFLFGHLRGELLGESQIAVLSDQDLVDAIGLGVAAVVISRVGPVLLGSLNWN